MNPTTTTAVIAVFTAIGGGGLASLINGLLLRGKTSADAESTRATATKIATETTLSIISDMRAEIARLAKRLADAEAEGEEIRARAEAAEGEVRALRRSVAAYRRRVEYLTELLEVSGIHPERWTPPTGVERT